MKKTLIFIIIIAVLPLLAGCGVSPTKVTDWEYRNHYLRDETVGLNDTGEIARKNAPVYPTSSRLPTAARPMTGRAEKAALAAELDSLYASGAAVRHELAYSAFSIDEAKFSSLKGVIREVYPQELPYTRLEYTGLFLPAGESVKVRVPQEYVRAGLKIAVNANRPDIAPTADYARLPRMYREYALTETETVITHPLGGVVDVYIPAGVKGAVITVEGCVRLGVYRLGIDRRERLDELSSHCIGVSLVDFAAGVAYLDRQITAAASGAEEALLWWNSALKTVASLSGENRIFRLYSDSARQFVSPYDNSAVFSLSSGTAFLDSAALKKGEGLGLVSLIGGLCSGLAGADDTPRIASDFVTAVVEKLFTVRRETASAAEPAAALAGIAAAGADDFSGLSAEVRSGMYTGLLQAFGAEKLAQLLRRTAEGRPYASDAERRAAFALSAAEIFGRDMTSYFELYKLNLTGETTEKMAALNYPAFYPVANSFASGLSGQEIRADYETGGDTIVADFAAATVDPFAAYTLTSVSCTDKYEAVGEGVYNFTLSPKERSRFQLVYENNLTGEEVVLSGAFVNGGECLPRYLPTDSGASDPGGRPLVNPRSNGITHKGEWFLSSAGAFAGGEALCGGKGAYLKFAFYGTGIAVITQNDSPSAVVKARIDGGKYAEYEVGGDNERLALDGLGEGEHTLELKAVSGLLTLKALSPDNSLYATDFSDFGALLSFPAGSYKDPRAVYFSAMAVGLPLLFAALVVLLLFSVVFPLINRKRGADLPCLTLGRRRGGQKEEGGGGAEELAFDREEGAERTPGGSKGKGYVGWEDNWVKEVALPPIIKEEKQAEKVVSPVLVANAPFLSEVRQAAEFVRAELSEKTPSPSRSAAPSAAQKADKPEEKTPARPVPPKEKPRIVPAMVRATLRPVAAAKKTPASPGDNRPPSEHLKEPALAARESGEGLSGGLSESAAAAEKPEEAAAPPAAQKSGAAPFSVRLKPTLKIGPPPLNCVLKDGPADKEAAKDVPLAAGQPQKSGEKQAGKRESETASAHPAVTASLAKTADVRPCEDQAVPQPESRVKKTMIKPAPIKPVRLKKEPCDEEQQK